jgi:two-component system response regulator MprA
MTTLTPDQGQPPSRVLVVDDDTRLLVSLSRGLSLRGFEAASSETFVEALSRLEAGWPHVVVLDVGMPGIDGITFCKLIRNRFSVPILMLTARDAVEDRVAGLEAGADDYLVKPFNLDELVARLRALVRRSKPLAARVLAYADITVDTASWQAARSGEALDLTAMEFKLLEAMMSPPETVCTREDLLTRVWGDPSMASSNVVDVHVTNLRRKLEAGGRPRVIQTVRRAGYKLQADP